MSEDIKNLEEKINALANRIYELHEPLDWNVIRPNLFPNKKDKDKGYTQKKLTDFIDSDGDWNILFWKIYTAVSKWERKFRSSLNVFDENKCFKYTDIELRALIYCLCKYDPQQGQFMHFFSKSFKGLIINAIKKEEGLPERSLETAITEDSQPFIDTIEDQTNNDLTDKITNEIHLDRLLNNLNKIYLLKNKTSDSNIDVKAVVCSYTILNEYLIKLPKDDLTKTITKYDFLKSVSSVILDLYENDKGKITLKEFCNRLGISYDAVAKERTRLKNNPLLKEKIDINDY